MSLGDHLEDLRRRLFLGLIGPVIAAAGLMLIAHSVIIPFLCIPLFQAMESVGQSPNLYFPHPGDAFGVYLQVSLIGGLIVGIPWLLYHLWRFISPGLYAHERKFVVMLLPGSAVLSAAGVLFMYYVMLPFTLWFLVGFASSMPMPQTHGTVMDFFGGGGTPPEVADAGAELPEMPILREAPAEPTDGQMWLKVPQHQLQVQLNGKTWRIPLELSRSMLSPGFHIRDYIGFVMWLALAFAIAFQLPLVMLMLGFVHLVEYEAMARARKYAFFGCFMVGAVLTPADPLSMFALAVPLYLLYEFGLVLVKLLVKRQRDPQAEAE